MKGDQHMLGFQQSKPRKAKIGTILDEEVIKKLKERSAMEGRSISAIIEEAVMKYDQSETMDRELRMRALDRLLSIRFNIGKEDWDAIMEQDYYEQ